jgi:hypothetical protein
VVDRATETLLQSRRLFGSPGHARSSDPIDHLAQLTLKQLSELWLMCFDAPVDRVIVAVVFDPRDSVNPGSQ